MSGRLEWLQTARDVEGRLVRDLVRRLLVRDTTQRLGCMKRAGLDIMEHKFYQTVDWTQVVERKLQPPLRPSIQAEWSSLIGPDLSRYCPLIGRTLC